MMKSALLLYWKLIADLISINFEINPYDSSDANKIINGKQLTACWHIDNFFPVHEDSMVVSDFLQWLSYRYDTTDKKLTLFVAPIMTI